MSIVISQTSIELRNPYEALLEPEQHDSHTTLTTADYIPAAFANIKSRAMITRAISDDDLDLVSVSSWSVVNSAYASDNEDDDEDDSDVEIYIDSTGAQLAPLTVAALRDGFTDISKTMTATSINSTSAAAAQPDVWVVKISKKRQRTHSPSAQSTHDATNDDLNDDYYDDIDWSETGASEELTYASAGEALFYMPMTEHELTKSAKAVKLKNDRVATASNLRRCQLLNIVPQHKSIPSFFHKPDRYTQTQAEKPRPWAVR
ncbi:hypothetical protein BGZ98_003097, partial [Dissophora globulifera]